MERERVVVFSMDNRGFAIIFHSGAFDRLYHGLSLALTAAALGRESRCFITYWALEYFRKKDRVEFNLDSEGETHKDILEDNIRKGHIHKISGLITEASAMGVKLYSCTSSMGLLNISRDELIDEVDMSMGMTTFMTEAINDQILFI
ncbi:MAG: DsrE/DsrF/DrsH-like family protein [Nitrospirae bacterium]|nr:DsrE/DsrF/DrsH-like family protein [Nitrospirota bacterium]